MRRSAAISAFLLGCVLAWPVQATDAVAPEHPATRATMQQIFEALVTLLPLSLDLERFQDPANQARVSSALADIAENAAALGNHGELDPSYEFLRRSLRTDAREALFNYERGHYEGAQFVLQQLTANCFACHSREGSRRSFDLGRRFLNKAELELLPLDEQARLAVSVRQFPRALELYEKMFTSMEMTPTQIDMVGGFEDYLKISIRVQQDFTRPIRTLETLRRRPDTPRYLNTHLSSWIAALKQLQLQKPAKDELAEARALIRAGQLESLFPTDPSGLVHYMAASAALHRYVKSQPKDVSSLSEAYYLLGVTEARVTHSLWLSETEYFLETAIRTDPATPHAEKAYAFLEEYLITGYSGSGGIHVPADIRQTLDELKALIDAGRTPAAVSQSPRQSQ